MQVVVVVAFNSNATGTLHLLCIAFRNATLSFADVGGALVLIVVIAFNFNDFIVITIVWNVHRMA